MKPMTDLEVLVRHLAGREPAPTTGQPNRFAGLARSVGDETNEASLVLDEIRRRTRSLFDEPSSAKMLVSAAEVDGLLDPVATSPPSHPRTASVNRDWVTVLLLTFLSVAATWGLIRREIDLRSNSLQQGGRAQIRDRIAIDRAVDHPTDRPVDRDLSSLLAACTRIEHDLAALDAKLDASARSVNGASHQTIGDGPLPGLTAVPTVDPGIAALPADLAALRREVAGSEMAMTRQIQEMRTVLQEVNTVVRRVLSRPQVAPASSMTLPILVVTVQALINNLQNPSAQIRGEAVEQLVRIGSPARGAIPALQQRLNVETDSNVRTAIEGAINVLTSN